MLKPPKKYMHPADIKAALEKKASSQALIATDLSISPVSVSHVIYGRSKSQRVAEAISKVTGIPVNTLWPGRYVSKRQLAHAA